ncbi:hypothetical protein N9D56_03470 [Methylophilaceae bacterium]|nr:hypothetical protein [Methylophilaceae bacterium]
MSKLFKSLKVLFNNFAILFLLSFFMESASIAHEQNDVYSQTTHQTNSQTDSVDENLDHESSKVAVYFFNANQDYISNRSNHNNKFIFVNDVVTKPFFFYSFLSQAP